jgi:hypothetical protein
VQAVLVGGMAAVLHGAAHVTGDLDFVYARSRDNLARLAAALAPMRPRLRDAPLDLPFVLDVATLRLGDTFTLTTTMGDVDLFGSIPGVGDYEAACAQAEEIELFGCPVLILSLDGLIRSKEAIGRDKDKRVLPELYQKRAELGPGTDPIP